MNTYRVYVLNTVVAMQPTITICYVQADKYGPAWQTARGALNAKKGDAIYTDAECKVKYTQTGDHVVVAKIDDIRPRNVKLDKTALQAVLNDPSSTPEEKLAAMTTLLG